MDAIELETDTLIIGCYGGWEHTDQHRHYSVTEAEICADNLDYDQRDAEEAEARYEQYQEQVRDYHDLDW